MDEDRVGVHVRVRLNVADRVGDRVEAVGVVPEIDAERRTPVTEAYISVAELRALSRPEASLTPPR